MGLSQLFEATGRAVRNLEQAPIQLTTVTLKCMKGFHLVGFLAKVLIGPAFLASK